MDDAASPGTGGGSTDAAQSEAQFEATYALAAQLDALRARARELYVEREPLGFDGFSALLDELLPGDDEVAERIGRAALLTHGELVHLRSGMADPLTLAPLAIARLGDAAALTLAQLEALVLRDHVHLAPSGGARPGAVADWAEAALASLRSTWHGLRAPGSPGPP